ncbi:Outer membrane protein beta-barrel domain-containing protein [Thiomicrospira sp. ALE5]|nr:Outer membrane protein beta-barrel domain-containing protein [Thiomicrospira sp. ALE5]
MLVGYGQTFDRFYFGGEFNYRNSLGDTKRSRDIADEGRFTAETQLGQSLSLSLMPGYLAMDNLLVYARFSYGLTEAETKFGFREQDGLFNQKFEYSGNVTTIGFGIGAEYALTNNISVRGEWMSLSSSNFDTTGILFDDGTDRFGIKAKTDNISTSGVELSLLYRF